MVKCLYKDVYQNLDSKTFRKEYQGINLDTLQGLVDDKKIKDALDLQILVELRLARKTELVKILGRGELKSCYLKVLTNLLPLLKLLLKLLAEKPLNYQLTMKKFLETLKNIYKIEELRNRILFNVNNSSHLSLWSTNTFPGIDAVQLAELGNRTGGGGLLGLINMFTGGAFANASVFALGIMPYISASIVVQLMGIAIPYLQKLQKEGESGRKTLNQITRWLTIAICVVQAPAYLFGLSALGVPDSAFVLGKGFGFMAPICYYFSYRYHLCHVVRRENYR